MMVWHDMMMQEKLGTDGCDAFKWSAQARIMEMRARRTMREYRRGISQIAYLCRAEIDYEMRS
jgi:hypothetical protein